MYGIVKTTKFTIYLQIFETHEWPEDLIHYKPFILLNIMSLDVPVLVCLLFETFPTIDFNNTNALKYLTVFDNINATLPWKYINRSRFD
jgi:hypothetical protein